MSKVYIVGHKNPDTDSVVAAIVYAKLISSTGVEAVPVRLGELNRETEFVLNKFGVEVPELVESLPAGSEVVLVDHNEASQSISNLDELKLMGIVDHHKFNLKTSAPLNIRAQALGSTCSILFYMFNEFGMEISKVDAELLISAIVSDTLFFRSPTTTEMDREIVEELNDIAKIESLEAFSLEMFDAKSDLGDMPVEEVVKLDYKVFNFGGDDYGIGVMETTSPSYGLNRKDEINVCLREIKKKDSLKGVFFSIVDILNEENLTLYSGESEKKLLVDLFGATFEDGGDVANLGALVSRKKQIVPKFEQHFN